MGKTIRIKLANPEMGIAEEQAAIEVLKSGWLVNGPRCRELEQVLKDLVGCEHVIPVSSGTMALFAAMVSMGIGPGATVLVSGLTFPAPASVAAFLGAKVRAVDVDPKTFNIAPEKILSCLDETVRMVVVVDQFGFPAAVPEIEQMLESKAIPVLVDAACSLGASLGGRPCGSFGKASAFSFHPRKVLTTGEGGAVLTDDDELAGAIRRFANHGMAGGQFVSTGLNLRMGELSAAIGRAQLGRLGKFVEKRRLLAQRYRSLPLALQSPLPGAEPNYQTLAALLPQQMTAVDRDHLIAALRAEGIEATIASYCLGAVPAIADQMGLDREDTPAALDIHQRGIALPLHTGLTDDDVDCVVAAVSSWLDSNGVGSV